MSLYYSQKQITKGVKFPLQIFAGSDHIILKMCYRTMNIWYAKLAAIGRKFFIKFTPRQPIPDIPITPREWQSDPEVGIEHDDLYAMAWLCEYDEPIFDSDYNNMATPTSPQLTKRSEQVADEMTSTPGNISGKSLEIIPQPDCSYDGMDMDHDMQSDADTNVEQLDPTPTNPRSSKYDLRHTPKPNCNDDYRYWICQATVYGTHTYTFRKSQEGGMELICGKPTYPFKHLAVFPKWLLSTTDRVIQFLTFTDTGILILIKLP